MTWWLRQPDTTWLTEWFKAARYHMADWAVQVLDLPAWGSTPDACVCVPKISKEVEENGCGWSSLVGGAPHILSLSLWWAHLFSGKLTKQNEKLLLKNPKYARASSDFTWLLLTHLSPLHAAVSLTLVLRLVLENKQPGTLRNHYISYPFGV